MKKAFLIFLGIILTVSLSGCGKKETTPPVTTKEATEAVKEAQKFNKAMEKGDEEDAAEALGNMMDLGADIEVKQLEEVDPVDLPDDFPSELGYSGGKVVSVNDYSDEYYLDLDAEIKTTDEVSEVKDHYKGLFSGDDWKITQQSAESGGAEFNATNQKNGQEIGVSIDRDMYSKITEIRISVFKTLLE